jgi:hypothetical protein
LWKKNKRGDDFSRKWYVMYILLIFNSSAVLGLGFGV